ncbi:MAG: Nin1 binding protein [Candelina mexicana]|nr:MAG: Nin1 binding protein [Candelina mexicana]
MDSTKSVHTIVLDAGPILKHEPAVSSLLAQSENLTTVPSVISEIRDPNARIRVQTTLLPFLTLRIPSQGSLKTVTDFARRTGDLQVLSRPDLQILALSYELECERNGGDWRLRRLPGQKGLNGSPPKKNAPTFMGTAQATNPTAIPDAETNKLEATQQGLRQEYVAQVADPMDAVVDALDGTNLAEKSPFNAVNCSSDSSKSAQRMEATQKTDDSDASDSEGWITPSNMKKHQARDTNGSIAPQKDPMTMQVATITTDFAMQNVLLQMNLNLLSPSLQRVKHLKTYILRCHACFEKTKDMQKQFCPRCGKPTLTRVACSTNQNGEFKIHLKKNMQWNTRGDRYSIPKPVSGSANGKVNVGGGGKGGGKGGWGHGLVLAEDQKEYTQAMQGQARKRERNLMDEDFLPSILTGDRGRAGGRVRVGAGKNVNSRKR